MESHLNSKPRMQGVVERFSVADGTISEEEVDKIVDMSVRAFEYARDKDGDISQDALIGHDWSLAPAYYRHIVLAGMFTGGLYGVRDKESQDIVAVGVWWGPGDKSDKLEEFKRKIGLYDFLDGLKPQFREWYSRTIPVLIKEQETFFTDEERARRWWCIHLCTEPRYHGRGLARLIIDSIHDKARKTIPGGFVGLGAGVEVNVKKYQSLGFRERGVVSTPIVASDMEVTIHVLSRED
ncbi:hypothetical protein BT96DRAFT_1021764 [Gymnopus androsaceus JB14]|uniref:N-acetyltransferase domain-containing protein n=1 Tax=Gymnopus androsaceus JB14 TaxID=1447944 RepID=A0A6A4HF54_9AGAR|nr:hypothetical protein BT96DRAFT_1021764 [Gymnopus androsaceus JB14]